MNDTELDDLLARSAAALPPAVARDAVALAQATAPARIRRGRTPRPRWFVPVVVAGSLALTAGASTTAVQLSQWPWVTMPEGNVRNTVPIPVDWVTDHGHVESCRAWIELRNQDDGDREALDAAIEEHDWNGFGQHLYDTGTTTYPDDLDGERRVGDELDPALFAFTRDALPGVLVFSEPGDTVAIDALGMTCRPDNP